ncbi:MAG: DNA polymerase III subunit delta [Gammaproteobacteria bacterium]|nr:DNA polymerase III subunit delta [Gammaproteobacteria bacterium]
MRLKAEQLSTLTPGVLAPVYLLSGDEPLLMQESADALRQLARQAGYSERIVMHAEGSFDWQELRQCGNSLSLFAQRRLIELRLPTGKPGDAGSRALCDYLEQPSADNLLLIVSAKIDKAAQSAKWFKAIDKQGVVIQVWPPDAQRFPAWLRQRIRTRGMGISDEALALLVERIEGNLLACDQEIEKLRLLHGTATIDAAMVLQAVVDSSRFDVYGLVDSALTGDAVRTAHILDGLRGEGIEPPVVLWALSRELRLLARLSEGMRQESFDSLCAALRVWESRKGLLRQGLQRHRPGAWRGMLLRAARIDRMIKGLDAVGNVWDELLQLSLMMAGLRTVRTV